MDGKNRGTESRSSEDILSVRRFRLLGLGDFGSGFLVFRAFVLILK